MQHSFAPFTFTLPQLLPLMEVASVDNSTLKCREVPFVYKPLTHLHGRKSSFGLKNDVLYYSSFNCSSVKVKTIALRLLTVCFFFRKNNSNRAK